MVEKVGQISGGHQGMSRTIETGWDKEPGKVTMVVVGMEICRVRGTECQSWAL